MQKEVWYYEKWVEGTEKCLFCENKQCLYETFLISTEKFYLVLKETKKNYVEKNHRFGIRENMSQTC